MNDAELARWYSTPGDPEVFEDIAAWFQRDTGHLRPGKDSAPGSGHTYECCRDAWLKWSEQKRGEAVRGLLAQRDRYREALEEIEEGLHAYDSDCLRAKAALNPKP